MKGVADQASSDEMIKYQQCCRQTINDTAGNTNPQNMPWFEGYRLSFAASSLANHGFPDSGGTSHAFCNEQNDDPWLHDEIGIVQEKHELEKLHVHS